MTFGGWKILIFKRQFLSQVEAVMRVEEGLYQMYPENGLVEGC